MRLSSVSRLAAVAMLSFLAGLLAIVGAFLVPHTLLPGLSAGVVIAVVGNFVVGTEGRRTTGSAVGAVIPGVTWLVVALALAGGRREGDVVLTSSTASIGFLLLGAMSWAIAIGRRRPSERPPPDDDPNHD